jgi:dinuclear metal center YbgI/SA1388 family protein
MMDQKMTATVSDIIELMDDIAPPCLAEEWDNVGLQIGDRRWAVRKLGIALDAGLNVVNAACRMEADMLITHHPLIFKPLMSLDCQTPLGATLQTAIQQRLSIFSAHTNLDKSKGGLNDILARRIDLQDCTVLEAPRFYDCGTRSLDDGGHAEGNDRQSNQYEGLGRVGRLPEPMTLADFALAVKKKLNLKSIRTVGNHDLVVKNAAVCTGSGSSLLKTFFDSGAQVYISGDLRFHDARDVEAAGLAMIDIGHFPSEYLMVESLVRRLTQKVAQNRWDVEVFACGNEADPFIVL